MKTIALLSLLFATGCLQHPTCHGYEETQTVWHASYYSGFMVGKVWVPTYVPEHTSQERVCIHPFTPMP